MWFHNRVPLEPDILYCTTSHLACIYAYKVLLPLPLPLLLPLPLPLLLLFCMCCYSAVVAAAPAVRQRVPDGKICCWFVESDPSLYLSLHSNTEHELIFMHPLAVLSLYGLDLPNRYTTSSALTGMRGAKAGGSPPHIYQVPCSTVYHKSVGT